jgi:serine/threonine protein phosphatase PrpC
MKLRAFGKSDIGLKRKLNEDSLLVAPDLGLYVIADGMGGHLAGEVASRIVVETMADYWRKVKQDSPPSFLSSEHKDLSPKARHLVNSILLSNMVIHEAQKRPKYHRMGSTVSALLEDDDCVWIANVGDSPVYTLDEGELILISEEHSLEAERKNQRFAMSETFVSAGSHFRNVLTRALGLSEKVEVYINPIRPEAGDFVLMCSDGLTRDLSESFMRTVLGDRSISTERKTHILIDEAKKAGGGDNISIILLEVLEEGKWQKFKRRFSSR